MKVRTHKELPLHKLHKLNLNREQAEVMQQDIVDRLSKYKDSYEPQPTAWSNIVPWDNDSIWESAKNNKKIKAFWPLRKNSKGDIERYNKPFHKIMQDYVGKVMRNTTDKLEPAYVPGFCALHKEEINRYELSDRFKRYVGKSKLGTPDLFDWEPLYKVTPERWDMGTELKDLIIFTTNFFRTKPIKELCKRMRENHPNGKYYPLTNKNIKWRL